MSSVCSSRCVISDAIPTTRIRTTYVNLHRWPESDAEFIRSLSFRSTNSCSSAGSTSGRHHSAAAANSVLLQKQKQKQYPYPPHAVVDTISCRQMYLRSAYTFTRRKETAAERTRKWVKGKVVSVNSRKREASDDHDHQSYRHHKKGHEDKKKHTSWNYDKVKEVPCAALKSFFRKLLFCSASVDVADAVYD